MSKFNSIFATKEFLEKVFEASEDGTAIVDTLGNILTVNPAFANTYGYSKEELENMHISQLACEEDLGEGFLEKHSLQLNEKGGIKLEEVINLKKDRSKIFVEISYTLLKDENGDYFCGLVIARDISERKRLEKDLRESEDKYRNLFENANEGVIIADKNNRIITLNKRAEGILGYSQGEIIGKSATILMPVRYQKTEESAMQRTFTTGQTGTYGKTFEIEMVRKDGTEVPVEATFSVVKRGDDFTFTLIIRDISERKQLEARLIQSERLNALGEMASGVAHDFNNLLATILGRVQLLNFKFGSYQGQERRTSTKYLVEGLTIIEKAATAGAEVVRRVQEFTNVAADTQNLHEIHINDLIKDVIEYMKLHWKGKADARGETVDIVSHLAPTLPPVAGNPSELSEVMTNIMKNSLEAMPDGGTLSLDTSLDDGLVVLSISDTGQGIPKEVRGRIFDPFFTTKGPQRMGLGMSVSYGIIKRHHGDITVQSEEGKGTSVIIKLPVAHNMGGKKQATALPRKEKKARVLVIDDEEEIRKLLCELLETVGHDVAAASDGEEGLKLFQDGPFDLVFTDLGMPGISGWEVAQEVKRLNSRTPVILVTGWGIQVDAEKKNMHGIDYVISKPFNIDQVTSLVQEELLKTSRDKQATG